MRRTFTVELTEREAATIWRMAAASGVPAAQIVRHLHRSTIFDVVASLAHDDTWTFPDDRTGQIVASEDMQAEHFRNWTRLLMDRPEDRP